MQLAFATLTYGELRTLIEKHIDKDQEESVRKHDVKDLNDYETAELFASAIRDKKQLFIEAHQFLDQQEAERGKAGELREVVVTGRKAKGVITTTQTVRWAETKTGGESVSHEEEREDEQPLYFIKQGDHWLIATEQEWERVK